MKNNHLKTDLEHIWHPYSAMHSDQPVYEVDSAEGVRIRLADGRELIDGMSSWWCVIHGYNHPLLNAAIEKQAAKMSHVMFGGLTHRPAIELTEKLLKISPDQLQYVFYSDSGSVSVEVAMKMAIQYWHARGKPRKNRFISLRNGYHGDTFGAMSVCDPVTGMHGLFKGVLQQQVFVEQPQSRFGQTCSEPDLYKLRSAIEQHHENTAALVLEPIVQGAGGMWFYSAEYLRHARHLCDQYDVLLIADEIATGFGRSGKMFACEHAGISPDIMCIGKALTGGYMTLAATLVNDNIASTIDNGTPGVFMHGPTFMANPLACSVALASIELLSASDWQQSISRIQSHMVSGLECLINESFVADVRVLGAIGVVEMTEAVDMKTIIPAFVDAGIWVRPFGRLVYLMPPYVISDEDLDTLISSLVAVLRKLYV